MDGLRSRLKNNNKKKKERGEDRSDIYSLAQDQFKKIQFEIVRNSLSNPWIRNVYIYIYIFTGFNFIAYVSSTTTFLFQIHSSIPFHSSFPPEILDLIRNLEIAIEKAIRD